MKAPKLNVKLLNRIKKHLRNEPKRYYQTIWAIRRKPEDGGPACGTQGCIAGWAVFLNVPKRLWTDFINAIWDPWAKPAMTISIRAKKLLGLNEREALKLFASNNQEHQKGEEGVEEACRKIDDLIADRASFVEKW